MGHWEKMTVMTKVTDLNGNPPGSSKHYTDSPLFKAFRPLFQCMKTIGLFHHKEYQQSEEIFVPLKKRVTPSCVYSFVMVTLLWMNFIRFFTLFNGEDTFGAILFQKVTILLYAGLSAVTATSCFLACHRYHNLPEFFDEWTRLRETYPGTFCTSIGPQRERIGQLHCIFEAQC